MEEYPVVITTCPGVEEARAIIDALLGKEQ